MVLQEAFQNNFYTDLLTANDAAAYGIDLEDLFDPEKKPEELLGIFISKERDDLFLLLDGNSMEINTLCDRWDERIRVFAIINGRTDAVQKLKYNIVQLIVYSGATPDKSREGNLLMSRKIIISGDLSDKAQIVIDDDEAIELPFHMIPADAFAPDEDTMQQLHRLLPADVELRSSLKMPRRRVKRTATMGTQKKSLAEQDYDKIKEWLENDHS